MERFKLMMNELPKEGFVRIDQIVGRGNPIPVCKATWWNGVRDGRFPKPAPAEMLGGNVTVWRVEDIRKFIEGGM